MSTKKRAPSRPKNPRFEVYDSPGLGPMVLGKRNPKYAYASWHWRLYARNGEIVASGEGYTTEKDALRGVKAVKRAVLAIVAAEEKALTPKLDVKGITKVVTDDVARGHCADYGRIGEATRPLRRRGRTQ